MASDLDRMLSILAGMDEDEKAALSQQVLAKTANMPWVPNLGPQTNGYYCEADELFYGGQAGGGKSDLIIGLALTAHQKSLILRRFSDDADELAERTMEIIKSREGWNGQKHRLRLSDKRTIDFGGMKEESDKERYKGRPHDLIGFDELPDFLRTQFEFVIAWNRSVDPNQRCRIVGAGNPPTQAEGLWVIDYWAPWLHPDHPKPAKDGEIRYFIQDLEGNEIEVDGRGPHLIGGEPILAKSRTFIRARLSDNPDLAATDYDARLAKLPLELRQAYREGRFDLGLKDRPWQVIPSDWLREAQGRWTPEIPCAMNAMGVDVAQGGDDKTVICPRHGWWFGKSIKIAGKDTPDGPSVAAQVIAHRRASAEIVMDMGGGYGGSAFDHLRANGIKVIPYKGNGASVKKTADRQLGFANKRAEVYWKFREALDPGQEGGSKIAIPIDPELFADLTAITWQVGSSGIEVTKKADLVKRMGRSPDAGDATVMAFAYGETPMADVENWRPDQKSNTVRRSDPVIRVNMGSRHKVARRR